MERGARALVEPGLILRLEIDPRAEIEMADAAAAYQATRPGYGRLFLADLDYTMTLLSGAPLLYQRIDGPIRRAVLRRFPYNLYYYIPDSSDMPRVFACRPDRADPAEIVAILGERTR